MKLQKIAIIGLLFLGLGLLNSCAGSKKGRCKECPEWTKVSPQNEDNTAIKYLSTQSKLSVS